ncbi:MAG TPA: DUF6279 family lipoprotein [Burkholderiales bacterium]|nr:DUF6279 family lipoprotein [Burkholderiales bacterium]
MAFLLSGCGALVKVAYNNSDTALRLLADDYFDIEGPQADALQAGLQRLHAWHRREELPRYANLFEDAGARISRGTQRPDVLWAIESVRARYRSLVNHAVDDAMPALATLNADNIAALEEKFAEKNEEFRREFLRGDAEDRERAQVKAYSKRLSNWIGDLGPEQERITVEFIRAHPLAAQRKLEERKRRQQDMVAILRQRGTQAELRSRLYDYFNNFERNRPPEYAEAAKRFESDFVDYVVAIDRSLSASQRTEVVERFARYARDFRTLAADKRSKDAGSVAAN